MVDRLAPMTSEDLAVLLAEGFLTEDEAEYVEIITREQMLACYPPEVRRLLGVEP